MPRPTRTRAASSRRRDAAPSSDPANAPVPVMTTTAEDTAAPPSRADGGDEEDDIYGVSDREMERQRVSKEARAEDLPTPAPATGRTTRSRATPTTTTNSTMNAAALRASRRRRDDALDKLDDLTSTIDGGSEPVVELGRRAVGDSSAVADSSLLGPRGGLGANLSGLEIHDDEIFGNLDSSFEDRDDSAAAAAPSGGGSGTRSADTSAFNVSVFRRQQPPSTTTRRRGRRRSSIVSKDDAPIRPSSRGPTTPGLSSTFSLGNFRRRQRQPSILLSSAQKASVRLASGSRAASVASGEDNDNAVESGAEEEEEEESFLPEAEGTPVRVSRGRPSSGEGDALPPDAEPGLSEAEAGADTNEGGRATRSRKRKSDQGHEGEATKRQAVEADDDGLDDLSDVEDHSSPPSFIEHRHRVVTPELDEAIFAPPASSSSHTGSPTMWPSLRDLGKKHRQAPPRARKVTPALEDDMSDLSEPPSLTHSPNYKANKPTAKTRRKSSPKLSTADLEALLPRRRRKVARGEYDLDDEDSNVSEQELPPPRATRKKPSRPLKGTSTKTNQTAGKAAKPTAAKKRSTRRTYGSRSFDKENTAEGESIEVGGGATSEPLDDTAFEADVNEEGDESTATATGLGGLSNELRAASRKFKEVDQWELDFEEVVEPSSDLPEGR